MLKPVRGDLKILTRAYEEHLLGTPIEKLKLTERQANLLQLYIKKAAQGLTACQISDASSGVLSSDYCAALRRIQRNVRRATKSIKIDCGKRKRLRVLSRYPALENQVKVKQKVPPLSITAVYMLRLQHYTKSQIIQNGGTSWLCSKCFKVEQLVEAGVSVAEIADRLAISQADATTIIKLYTENQGLVKLEC